MTIAFILITFTYVFNGVVFYISFPLSKACIEDVSNWSTYYQQVFEENFHLFAEHFEQLFKWRYHDHHCKGTVVVPVIHCLPSNIFYAEKRHSSQHKSDVQRYDNRFLILASYHYQLSCFVFLHNFCLFPTKNWNSSKVSKTPLPTQFKISGTISWQIIFIIPFFSIPDTLVH